MKKLIIIPFLILAFASCTNSKENKASSEEKPSTAAKEKSSNLLHTGCYTYNANNNSIKFRVKEVGKKVKGDLSYALNGKDANTGTFTGTLKVNKLIGSYTFNSEGKKSTREVAFLVKNNRLIEGYGPLNETGTKFKDKEAIKYTSKMPLTKTGCDN